MKILFINQYYAPDYAATAQLMSDVCEHLAELGHEVHVISSRSLYDGRDISLPAYEVLNGVHVHRLALATGKRGRFRQQALGYASFYLKAFAKVHTVPKPDIVVTLTTPPLISLLGAWLRLIRGSRFVYWVMDIYPDIAERAGILNKRGVIHRVWSALGRLSYKFANEIVVLGRDMKRVLVAKGVDRSKIEIIQTWAKDNDCKPDLSKVAAFRQDNKVDQACVAMYSGNLGACHLFDEFIAAAKDTTEVDKLKFLFVGGGKQLPKVKEALGDQNNVLFLPYQDREDLPHSLAAADVHLVSLNPKYDGLLVPSKLYGIMAAGRPVVFVGSEDNEVATILREAECGYVVAPEDTVGLKAILKKLADEPEHRIALGRNGQEYFCRNFSESVLLEQFGKLLQRALPERESRTASSPAKADII